ncbi:DgyrCDS11685 [Dimorphilus gyrociliatus]|uniref:DgyrCDS11685 n=1 Tax=Dimorphilus gyrociliatus TaxID=2664684 RepID=A0A7I8W881_9ANNE|nr:DgyrCDS11685 [Dimorphilus gyrociliatus]
MATAAGDHGVETSKTNGSVFVEGKPLQVIQCKEGEHKLTLDEDAIRDVLLSPEICNKNVAVVSVAGAFRKGKSFLLDFFLRYLEANGSEDWLGNDTASLEGFPWRGGSERDTTGMLLWSKPFVIKRPNGEEVAVLLMDTQGAFDSQSTVKDCATVFALSTLLSSVQVYNISMQLQENDLQHLQVVALASHYDKVPKLFTEYGRLALQQSDCTPFQHLEFLVRDWPYAYEYDYGDEGGNKFLTKKLAIEDNQHPELQCIREHIKSCFSSIGCFLMPHPGLKVANSPHFDGRLQDIEKEFKDALKKFIPMVLSAENLVVKKIQGEAITAKQLLEYFKSYIKMYDSDELPEPKSMLQATAEANNLSAVATAKEQYIRDMEEFCGGDKPYVGPDILKEKHDHYLNSTLEFFDSKRKMGGPEFSLPYRTRLEEELIQEYERFISNNDSKNVFAAARTPAVFLSLMIICYLIAGILGILGLESLANLFNLLMGLSLVVVGTWAYVRYSGEYRDIGSHIDSGAEMLWDSVLGPICMKLMQSGAQQAFKTKKMK